MASSELSTFKSAAASASAATDGAAGPRKMGKEDEERAKEDIYTAAAYGDMDKMQRLVEQEGHAVEARDSGGYSALQWAALNNKAAIAQYLLERGADVNATDSSGQTALHWSAVRGALSVAEVLLQNGAQLEVPDCHGYRVSHVAAQYGQTAFLYHISIKWNAQPDALDNDGRSPLHWAAYKGFTDPIRLLLFLDAFLSRPDKEGCTPLHWAAIKGNLEAATLLVQAGTLDDLEIQDVTGCTPGQLAADKGHRHVALFLSNARQVFHARHDSKGKFAWLMRLGLAPFLVSIIVGLLGFFFVSVVFSPSLGPISTRLMIWSWLVAAFVGVGLVFFYRAAMYNPGFIIPSRGRQAAQKDEEMSLLVGGSQSDNALASGNWAALCVTCRIVRPTRSKHCSVCNKCVEQFDHHCPWISNCVGKKNKRDFLTMLILELSAMVLALAVAICRLVYVEGAPSYLGNWLHFMAVHQTGALLFILSCGFMMFSVLCLTLGQGSQVAQNVTTNEMSNAYRYSYLKGPDNKFFNPYDHGCIKNCSDLWIKGENSDVEKPWAPPKPGHPVFRKLFGGSREHKCCSNHGPSSQHPHQHAACSGVPAPGQGALANGNGAAMLDIDVEAQGRAASNLVESNDSKQSGRDITLKSTNSKTASQGGSKAPVGLGLGLGSRGAKAASRAT